MSILVLLKPMPSFSCTFFMNFVTQSQAGWASSTSLRCGAGFVTFGRRAYAFQLQTQSTSYPALLLPSRPCKSPEMLAQP